VHQDFSLLREHTEDFAVGLASGLCVLFDEVIRRDEVHRVRLAIRGLATTGQANQHYEFFVHDVSVEANGTFYVLAVHFVDASAFECIADLIHQSATGCRKTANAGTYFAQNLGFVFVKFQRVGHLTVLNCVCHYSSSLYSDVTVSQSSGSSSMPKNS